VRIRHLLWPLAPLLGAATAALPGLSAHAAAPAGASFVAVDYRWEANGGSSNLATVEAGASVSFAYPAGNSMHNVDFGSGPAPTSCTMDGKGVTPPVPGTPQPPGWSASCTFDTPGTYTFHCDMHPAMTGTIVVGGTTTTTTATGTTTTSTTTPTYTIYPTTTGTTPSSTGRGPRSPLAGSPERAVHVARRQHGRKVRGSIAISAAGRGGEAAVELLARLPRRHAGGEADSRPAVAGRFARSRLREGTLRFAVALRPRALRALERTGRLPLSVSISVTSPAGVRASARRRVLLLLR
jgi:plastocyanin